MRWHVVHTQCSSIAIQINWLRGDLSTPLLLPLRDGQNITPPPPCACADNGKGTESCGNNAQLSLGEGVLSQTKPSDFGIGCVGEHVDMHEVVKRACGGAANKPSPGPAIHAKPYQRYQPSNGAAKSYASTSHGNSALIILRSVPCSREKT